MRRNEEDEVLAESRREKGKKWKLKDLIMNLTVRDLIAKEESFSLFMHHLCKEFAMECLLSVIEFTQFRELLSADKEYMSTSPIIEGKRKEMVVLPPSIIQSHIVFGTDGSNDPSLFYNEFSLVERRGIYWKKAIKLYRKYVKRGAEFQINIGSLERESLDGIFQRVVHLPLGRQRTSVERNERFEKGTKAMENEHLAGIFDKCVTDMLGLTGGSMGRFTSREEFKTIRKLFAE